jgi:carboxyl-terminal processing protease
MKRSKKFLVIGAIFLVALVPLAFTGASSYFEVSKNLDIFTTLYKELNTYYVDTLNPDKLVHTGIDNMLESLDPYTDYIPEEDMDDRHPGGLGSCYRTL